MGVFARQAAEWGLCERHESRCRKPIANHDAPDGGRAKANGRAAAGGAEQKVQELPWTDG
jgi:hypothetical protein